MRFQEIPESNLSRSNTILAKRVKEVAPNRPLSDEELNILENAIKYPVSLSPLVPPIIGTLSYAFRNVDGGNSVVTEVIFLALEEDNTAKSVVIRRLLNYWKTLDENSRNRLDIFDILCKELMVSKIQVLNAFYRGLREYTSTLSKMNLESKKQKLIERVDAFGAKEANFNDRKLMAELTELLPKAAPLVSIQENSETTHNSFSFTQIVNKSYNAIRGDEINEVKNPKPKELAEGNKEDYIEADFTDINREKEIVKQ